MTDPKKNTATAGPTDSSIESGHAPSDLADEDRLEAELTELLGAYDDALSGESMPAGSDFATSPVDPELAAELQEAKACLELLKQLWPRTDPACAAAAVQELADVAATRADGDDGLGQSVARHQPESARRFGRFTIVRELGRGGGGTVLLAEETNLGRKVALKLPNLNIVFSPDGRRRFVQEGQVSARLDHPNIVSVYEAAEVGPFCYIASAFCDGPTLADWLKGRQQPVPVRMAAQIVAALADAVEHAHGHGILHRDVKPSNVLLEPRKTDGAELQSGLLCDQAQETSLEFTPKLTDFGLAKLLERGGDQTSSGARLGTLPYMAPEQAEGRLGDIRPATDVYGLGVILYELLTGRPPYDGRNEGETLQKIASEEPQRPRRLRRKVPRDLESICLKCLEKEPGGRYAHAADLARDLRRFLTGLPTDARPVGLATRAAKWARRQPALTTILLAVSSLLLVALVCGALWHWLSVQRAEEQADIRVAQQSEQSRQQLRRFDYATCIQGAYQAWQNADVASGLELLERCRPGPGEQDVRGFEWYYVRRLCDGGLRTLRGHEGRVFGVAFSPGGNRLASCGDDGTVRLWDPVAGRLVATIAAHADAARAVAFSPDGRSLASAGDDAEVRLWDAATHQLQATLEGHAGPVTCLAFSPDGQVLATGGADGAIKIWDVPSVEERLTIQGHADTVHSLAFAPDGLTLASGSADKTTKVWDLGSPVIPLTVVQDPDKVYAVAISPDTRTLASGGFLRLWSVPRGQQLADLGGHGNHVRSIEFSPDGQTLATASEDSTIRIWERASNTTKYIYHAHTGPVYDVAFSPQGSLLASASRDGTVRLWDPTVPQDRRPLPMDFRHGPLRVAFAPDSSMLAVGASPPGEKRALLWPLGAASAPRVLPLSPNCCLNFLAFSPSGRELAAVCDWGPVILWSVSNPDDVRTIQLSEREQYVDCEFSPCGKHLAVAGSHMRSVQLLDVDTGTVLEKLPGQRCVAFSPDGHLIVMESATYVFAIELWNLTAGQSMAVLPGHTGQIYSAAFSADGQLLATASEDGTARLWDVATATPRFTLRGHDGRVNKLAFSPAGRSLATAGIDGTVKFWDADTGRLLLSLPVTKSRVESLAFSPDGRILATGSYGPDGKPRVDMRYAPREEDALPP